jgi:hypothetical protein
MEKKFSDILLEMNQHVDISAIIEELIVEVEDMHDIKKDTKSKLIGKHITSAYSKYGHDSQESKLPHGHTLHHINSHNSSKDHHFVVSDHKGNITHHIETSKVGSHEKSAHHVNFSSSSGTSKIKMHDVYHHLLKKGHVLATSGQSEGGEHIWSHLQKKKDVNIHGWHPKTGKAENVDLKHGTDETHMTQKTYKSIAKGSTKDESEAHKTKSMWLIAHHKRK